MKSALLNLETERRRGMLMDVLLNLARPNATVSPLPQALRVNVDIYLLDIGQLSAAILDSQDTGYSRAASGVRVVL